MQLLLEVPEAHIHCVLRRLGELLGEHSEARWQALDAPVVAELRAWLVRCVPSQAAELLRIAHFCRHDVESHTAVMRVRLPTPLVGVMILASLLHDTLAVGLSLVH